MTRLCKCNTCEAIYDRVVKQIGGMLRDQECVLCVEATAYAYAVLAEQLVKAGTLQVLRAEGRLTGNNVVDGLLLASSVDLAQNSVAEDMVKTWNESGKQFVDDINDHVQAAHKARMEERNLPKDT